MADLERENSLGFVDKRRSGAVNRNTQTTLGISSEGNYDSVGALRARLGAITGPLAGYFTAGRLNTMTKNDMVAALRQVDDAAGRNTGST